MAKIRLEDIQAELAVDGWKLISTEYVNLDTEMIFECPEGHRVFAPWKKLRGKHECSICKKNSAMRIDTVLPKPKNTKRVLALDQASKTTGFAVFDNGKLVKYGSFATLSDDDIERFAIIKEWLVSMINNWRPDYIGIEGIQFQEEGSGQKMGVTVFQTLARLQGILMLVCHEAKIPYTICPTNTWRHACGVKGRSRTDKKRSMQLLAKQWYDVTVTDDEADAIGIGRYLTSHIQKNTEITNWET